MCRGHDVIQRYAGAQARPGFRCTPAYAPHNARGRGGLRIVTNTRPDAREMGNNGLVSAYRRADERSVLGRVIISFTAALDGKRATAEGLRNVVHATGATGVC